MFHVNGEGDQELKRIRTLMCKVETEIMGSSIRQGKGSNVEQSGFEESGNLE